MLVKQLYSCNNTIKSWAFPWAAPIYSADISRWGTPSQELLCKLAAPPPTHLLEVSEGHELHDVSQGRFARGRAQVPVIAVQELHGAEVGPAHPHDDDGHGQARGVDDGGARLVQVRDNAVRDDQQDEVLLGTVGEEHVKNTKWYSKTNVGQPAV